MVTFFLFFIPNFKLFHACQLFFDIVTKYYMFFAISAYKKQNLFLEERNNLFTLYLFSVAFNSYDA